MAGRSFLDWPFLDGSHRKLFAALDEWCGENDAALGFARRAPPSNGYTGKFVR